LYIKTFKMKRIAVFPGSFDPVTKGHESIVVRAIPLFDEIIVAIGENSEKKGYFPVEKRLEWVSQVFRKYASVRAIKYHGLTVDLCKQVNANYILRGLRTSADFEFERSIGQINKNILPQIETVFLLTSPEYTHINSSIIREIHRNGGDVKQFIPDGIVL
jgi:pantetheine-phosphate adenylyltransferase